MMGTKKIFIASGVLGTIVLVAWLISCAVNPVTGKKEFMLLTEQDEVALGQQTDAQVVATYHLWYL